HCAPGVWADDGDHAAVASPRANAAVSKRPPLVAHRPVRASLITRFPMTTPRDCDSRRIAVRTSWRHHRSSRSFRKIQFNGELAHWHGLDSLAPHDAAL